MTDDDLLTMDEVAERTRTPVATLRYWRHIGFGPPSFKLGRRVVCRRGDLEQWIEQRRTSDSTD